MTVLITGGAGYIGSHTCLEVLQAGFDIVVLDNFCNSHREVVRRVKEISQCDFPVYEVDLLDATAVESVFANHDVDAVIHFAGFKAPGESVSDPLKYYRNNIVGTLVLLETMQKFEVTRLVFSSSATVYATQDKMPLTETMRPEAINPYGQTKVMIEQILRDLSFSRPDWGIALLRYFNPIGAHVSGRIGEDPTGIPNNLVPYITQVAVGKLKELLVYGDDYPTPDGTCIRDYIHVMDLAAGHVKALERVFKQPGIDAYNLGTGRGYSVLEVIETFEQASGVKIPWKITQRRPGDAPISYADPSKAANELGWRATRSLLEMCRDAWRWQRDNPNGYEPAAKRGLRNG
ncbi:MAG: UDP-glucose 4-epimerase GalE [Alicyclobacillus sp.]|nr:UDP-glucose 4-epimerase GalE [Alicyclobacillus sp.]